MTSMASNPAGHVSLMIGADGLIIIVFFFAGLIAAWWALAAVKWDKFVNQPLSPQATMLRFFLSLCGGLLAVLVAVLLLGAMQVVQGL
ncbi:DUF1146 family protein [Alicyclobacillus dauci]|uniref:DUF1146 family protein n=1 Tax=Alicyclobacillus dauci TaxID=1475485 RepID=A0ABY6Z1U3_9BACL|nr:DUF1146 family protein [Alicyclobacillus dauci]WAH36859.1 DUF1146 family protein [Alicyclobacillus dauci]